MIQQLGEGNILKMYKKLRNIGNIFHLFLYFLQISAVLMALNLEAFCLQSCLEIGGKCI